MNRARRRLTSVIEQISMSERRIPYVARSNSILLNARNTKIIFILI